MGLEALNLLVIGSLPARVRKMYRLRWTPAHAAAYRAAAARAPRGAAARPDQAVRRGSCEQQFARVARAEKRWGRAQAERAAAAAEAAAARS